MRNFWRHPDENREAAETLGAAIWLPILFFFATSALIFFGAGFQFAPPGGLTHFGPLIIGAAACYLVGRSGKARRLASVLSAYYQMALIWFGGLLLAYAAATLNRPLVDSALLQLDRALGYEWTAYAGFVAQNRTLNWLLVLAYASIGFQPLILLPVLSAPRHARRLEQFVLAGMVSLAATIAIFACFPATTAWAHLNLSDSEIRQYLCLPLSGDSWIRDLLEIRGGGRLVDGAGSGVVAFPSFHCISALLYVWAAWPIRWLRPGVAALNILMLLGTPLSGGHYVADLIAGAAVTVLSLMLVRRFYDPWLARACERRNQRASGTPAAQPPSPQSDAPAIPAM